MSEPTAQQWLDLYGAFKDFCQATPWEWVDDTYVPVIEDPAGQYRGYCVVLGGGGMQYGLAVFMGEEGLAAILALMTGSVDSESADSLYELNTVSAMLADRGDLENQDRATIRELGLKYRGRGSWPLFRRTFPGYLPWFLEADEAVFLTMALRYVIDLVEKIPSGEFAGYSASVPDLAPTRVFRNGEWLDQWEPIPTVQPRASVPDYPDLGRLQRLIQGASKGQLAWELGIFYINRPTQERRGERPYFPELTLAVEPNNGLVLAVEVNGPAPSAVERQDTIVRVLEKFGMLPAEIIVDSVNVANLLETITPHLGIKLSVGATPALDAAKEEMFLFT